MVERGGGCPGRCSFGAVHIDLVPTSKKVTTRLNPNLGLLFCSHRTFTVMFQKLSKFVHSFVRSISHKITTPKLNHCFLFVILSPALWAAYGHFSLPLRTLGGIIVEVLLTRGKASTSIPISERQSFYCFRWEVSQRLRWGGAPPLWAPQLHMSVRTKKLNIK